MDCPSPLTETLHRLAVRVSDPDYDARHAILDVSAEFLSLERDGDRLPPQLRHELRDLVGEIRSIQPHYPSRRETSPLFDRAGLGRPARERAERLVRRLVALAVSLKRAEVRPPGSAGSTR